MLVTVGNHMVIMVRLVYIFCVNMIRKKEDCVKIVVSGGKLVSETHCG